MIKNNLHVHVTPDEFKPLGYELIDTIGKFLGGKRPTQDEALIIIAALEGVKVAIAEESGIEIDRIDIPE